MTEFKVAEIPTAELLWSGTRAHGAMRCPYCNESEEASLIFGLFGDSGVGDIFVCMSCGVNGHVESKSVLLVLKAARND
jgi:hypothetical protein